MRGLGCTKTMDLTPIIPGTGGSVLVTVTFHLGSFGSYDILYPLWIPNKPCIGLPHPPHYLFSSLPQSSLSGPAHSHPLINMCWAEVNSGSQVCPAAQGSIFLITIQDASLKTQNSQTQTPLLLTQTCSVSSVPNNNSTWESSEFLIFFLTFH